MFDAKTQAALSHYVYMLIDSRNNEPFYVGKGSANRVFQHINEAISCPTLTTNKLDKIREIQNSGNTVEVQIICHGLQTEQEAFCIECAVIDVLNYLGKNLANAISGHHSHQTGIMSATQIKNIYNAQPLDSIANNCVIININRQYNRCMGQNGIYQATKECWRMSNKRMNDHKLQPKYVLSEYRGLIIEVFEASQWYPKQRAYSSGKKKGQYYTGWGFNGVQANPSIRNKYINRSIAHKKHKGQVNPIMYKLP